MNLTARHNEILRAALSYAVSNVDDINDAIDLSQPLVEEEVLDLYNMLGFNDPPPAHNPGHGCHY